MDFRKNSMEPELQTIYQTSSLESEVLTDTEEVYEEYTGFYDKRALDDALGSSINCLNLFERGVQDPYSSGCDNEDSCSINDILSDQLSLRERGSQTPEVLNSDLAAGEIPRLNITESNASTHNYNWDRISARRSPITPDLTVRRLSPLERRSPIIIQNPAGSSSSIVHDIIDRDRQLLLRRTETAPPLQFSPRRFSGRNLQALDYPNMDDRLTPKRTNTPLFARDNESVETAGLPSPTFLHVPTPVRGSRANINGLLRQTARRPASRPVGSRGERFGIDNPRTSDQYYPRPGLVSFPSSPSVISHLHSLEKYVSSDLDAISSGDKIDEKSQPANKPYESETPPIGVELLRTTSGEKLALRTNLPTLNDSALPIRGGRQNSDSGGSRARITIPKSYTPLLARPREKSFIERSLSNSFSRGQ